MNKKIFSTFSLMIIFTLLIGFAVAQDFNCYPPENGNWFVNETVICQAKTIVLNGSLLINASGNLTLENVLLQFNSSFDGEFGIENNGSLRIVRSKIENSSESEKAYTFVSNTGGKLELIDSFILKCGFASLDNKKNGVYIKSESSNITNTTFSSNYIALMIYSNNNNVSKNTFISNYKSMDVKGSNNLIEENEFKENVISIISMIGENISFQKNLISDNVGNNLTIMNLNYSIIHNNTLKNNNATFSFSGKNVNITNNIINSNNFSGMIVTNSEYIKISNNTILHNKEKGIYLLNTKNITIQENLVNKSGEYDIYLLSAKNTDINNNNYTNLIKKWVFELKVFDNDGQPVVSANVTIKNNLSAIVFLGLTNSSGIIKTILDEIKINDTDITKYNPYNVTVKKDGYYVNSTSFNITNDYSLDLIIQKIPPPPEELLFNFTILSPLNKTYLKYNLTNSSLLLLNVTSQKNMSFCNYSFDGDSYFSITQRASNIFWDYINVSQLNGTYHVIFVCNSSNNITNTSSVWFTLYPNYECLDHNECKDDERCVSHKCQKLNCESQCGYASNHACVFYECCSDDKCNSTSFCNLTTHICQPVICICPEKISNHKCDIPIGYCCKDSMCGENETCVDHTCVEQRLNILNIPEEIVEGQNITIKVVDQNNKPVNNVKIEVIYVDLEDPVTDTFYTNNNGEVTIEIKYYGKINLRARKENYYLAYTQIEAKQAFNIFFILEIIILIGAVLGIVLVLLNLKKKGGFSISGGGPFKLEKTISGQHVILRIKNKTKRKLEEIMVHDILPKNAFIGSRIQPKIEPWDTENDLLTWEILLLEPKEEVVIEYFARFANKGFWVVFEGKEFHGK